MINTQRKSKGGNERWPGKATLHDSHELDDAFERATSPHELLSVLTDRLPDMHVSKKSYKSDQDDKADATGGTESLSSSPESGIGASEQGDLPTPLSQQIGVKGMTAGSIQSRVRSMSESYTLNGQLHLHGILKRPARRLSETHRTSECCCPISSAHSSTCCTDCEMSADECNRLSQSLAHGESLLSFLTAKKCVRFNDRIQEKCYRRNASIIGQKKKTEKRKLDRERRRSSDSITSCSDTEPCNNVALTGDDLTKCYNCQSIRRPLSFSGGNDHLNDAPKSPPPRMQLTSVGSSITPIKEQPIAELMAASAVQSRVVNIAKNIGSKCVEQQSDSDDDEHHHRNNREQPNREKTANDSKPPPTAAIHIAPVEDAKARNKKRKNKNKKRQQQTTQNGQVMMENGSSDTSLSQSLPAMVNGWSSASSFAVRYDNDEKEDDDWIEVTSARRSLRIRSATTEEDDDYDDE